MVNKLFTLLLTFVLAFSLSVSLLSQEVSKQEEAKESPAQEKAEKGPKTKKAKPARWTGMVVRSDKDKNTLTVRKRGSTAERIVHYDGSTQFTSQEHGSKKVNNIDASQVKDDDRVICLGSYDDKGEFHASLISKRLSR